MAHYAKVWNKKVTTVIVADADFIKTYADDSPGRWVKTSYNMRGGVYYDPSTGKAATDQSVIAGDEARERKNYAGIGWYYDNVGFYPPQPFGSWKFNSTTYLWDAPVAYPDDGKVYVWNEYVHQVDKTKGWELFDE